MVHKRVHSGPTSNTLGGPCLAAVGGESQLFLTTGGAQSRTCYLYEARIFCEILHIAS